MRWWAHLICHIRRWGSLSWDYFPEGNHFPTSLMDSSGSAVLLSSQHFSNKVKQQQISWTSKDQGHCAEWILRQTLVTWGRGWELNVTSCSCSPEESLYCIPTILPTLTAPVTPRLESCHMLSKVAHYTFRRSLLENLPHVTLTPASSSFSPPVFMFSIERERHLEIPSLSTPLLWYLPHHGLRPSIFFSSNSF